VWRTYDRQGQLAEVAIDTNFDGRSDIHEYYQRGTLVRRESDRNFDNRVDLVQLFDSTTHDEVRDVEDVDYDGTADRLVLFQGGRSVFSKWARPGRPAVRIDTAGLLPRTADDPLEPLADPFQTDLAIRAVRVVGGSGDGVGLSTFGGLPVAGLEFLENLTPSPVSARPALGTHRSPLIDLHSSRGPPPSLS
jgi:hypothetical protein